MNFPRVLHNSPSLLTVLSLAITMTADSSMLETAPLVVAEPAMSISSCPFIILFPMVSHSKSTLIA